MSKKKEAPTLRQRALAFSDEATSAMALSISASFARRDAFEATQGLDIAGANSYTKARAKMEKASVAVSRLFLALNIEPSSVIERQVVEGAMFNAKALDKVTEIASYVVGVGHRLQMVTRAFVACALVSSDKGIAIVGNEVNRRFLNSDDLATRIADVELLDHIALNRHKAMTSGAATQSSQARNVLDVLGLGTIRSIEKARDAIEIDPANLFYTQFRQDFLVTA